MKQFKLHGLAKMIGITIGGWAAIIVIFIAFFVGYTFFLKANQVTQAEADKVCQEFFQEVKSDISAVPGYTVTGASKSCDEGGSKDEAGNTDYYFSATFQVAKAGSDTVDGLKANIKNLADRLSDKNYDMWIENVPATDAQPAAISVNADRQIQETGEVYQSSPPGHYPSYCEPGSLEKHQPCESL